MFGKKEPKIVTSINHFDSLISAETSVDGPIVFKGSLKICGTVNGNILALRGSTTVLIEKGANVSGCISADVVIVSGEVNGNIEGTSVYLTETANVNGSATIKYKVIQIDPGAKVAGTFVQLGTEEQATQVAQLEHGLAIQ